MFLRMIALLFAMVCGVFICAIRLKQISTPTRIRFQSIRVIQIPDIDYRIKHIEIPRDNGTEQPEIPHVHYPKPQTFSR